MKGIRDINGRPPVGQQLTLECQVNDPSLLPDRPFRLLLPRAHLLGLTLPNG